MKKYQVYAVINGKEPPTPEIPGGIFLAHCARHAHERVHFPKRQSVERAVNKPGSGPVQIVEPVIAVDRRYDRHAERRAEQRRRQIGAAAVAADEIEPAG